MPPTSHFVLAAAGVVDGAAKAGGPPVSSISLKHVYEIAKVRATSPSRMQAHLAASSNSASTV